MFFCSQSTLSKKVRSLGTVEEDVSGIEDPFLNAPFEVSGSLMTWKSVVGITYLPNDSCICVAGVGFKSMWVLHRSRVERYRNTSVTKAQPIFISCYFSSHCCIRFISEAI